MKSYLPIEGKKIGKNTEVAIEVATNKRVEFRIINEQPLYIHKTSRATFDKYFTKVDILNNF